MTSPDSENGKGTRCVCEIMIPLSDYPHLPVWSTLREAIELMQGSQLEVKGRKSLPRTVLLFELDGSIAGIVRRRDLMMGLEPEFLVSKPLDYTMKLFDVDVDPNLTELSFDKMVEGIRQRVDRPVTDVMRPIKKTINHDDHIMKAIYEMVTDSLSLLPVMQDGEVVGLIRTVDVFNEITKIIL
jgi:CBS domain-containing protein